MGMWTKAEERLPEHDTDCWINMPCESPESVRRGHFFLDPSICADGIWSHDYEHHCVCANIVTHWMPYYTPALPADNQGCAMERRLFEIGTPPGYAVTAEAIEEALVWALEATIAVRELTPSEDTNGS